MKFKTKFEEFAYNKRMNEFFEKVYNHEPIALLNRRDYKTTEIIIRDQSLCIGLNGNCQRQLVNISNKDVDSMAHLYASYQTKELQYFLEDTLKYDNYLSNNYNVTVIEEIYHDRHVFYSEGTIEQFKNCNGEFDLEKEDDMER